MTELTIALAVGAGLLSFLSPCVLPLVPAYVGQLTAVAVAGRVVSGGAPSRWFTVRHALAFVGGFGLVFGILGITATFVAGPLVDYLPILRQVGGAILIVLGLNLAGIIRLPLLERTWRPLEIGAAASVAAATGTTSLASPGASGGGVPIGDRLGGQLVARPGSWLASFGLGAIFAVGWTPCIGVILGGILMTAATSETAAQGTLLLAAYTLGLGVPFVVIAAVYDRAPRLLRPILERGALVSLVGGLLVVGIGVAMIMDWLALLPQYFQFLSQI